MIKNFNGLKKQLGDLAVIINSFKSEAVQLRLVELIFRGAEIPGEEEKIATKESGLRPTKRKRVKVAKKKVEAKREKAAKAGRGPATILSQLIEEGFFQSKRRIGDIIAHAKKKKARKLKGNELSGSLLRFVGDGRLARDLNKDGQYEYYKK